MKEYILSLDQGTTSSRAVLFNAKGEKVASVQKEYPQIFPGNGWVEHDPMDILESQLSSAREVIAKAGGYRRRTWRWCSTYFGRFERAGTDCQCKQQTTFRRNRGENR